MPACLSACRADDLQVEFIMLDPYVRLPLKHDGQGTFSVQFKVRGKRHSRIAKSSFAVLAPPNNKYRIAKSSIARINTYWLVRGREKKGQEMLLLLLTANVELQRVASPGSKRTGLCEGERRLSIDKNKKLRKPWALTLIEIQGFIITVPLVLIPHPKTINILLDFAPSSHPKNNYFVPSPHQPCRVSDPV